MAQNNDYRITSGLDKIKIKYTDKFAGIVAKKLNESPIMQWTAKTGIKIENGNLIYFKAGADEEIEAARSKVNINAWSNVEDELKIPFNTEYSTKGVLLDKNEYIQFELGGNPQALNDQSLLVKADKLRKLIGRVTMGLWMSGKTEDNLKCGDGEIPVHSFEWKTDLATNTRKEIAEDFDRFQRFMDIKIEEIKRIGINDINGKNAQDPYRTGVEVDNSSYSIATSPNFRRRYQIWVSVYNETINNLQEGSYGNLNGFNLYEDIFLPYIGITTKGMTTKSGYGNENKIEIIEGNQSVEFMFIKKGNLIKGNVFDFMWTKQIDRSEAKLVGWSGKLGAGTIFSDEMFAIDFIKTTTKINISKINKLDKPTIHVADPTKATPEQLKPQFKDVVLKAVKAVNSSLTENDFDYFIESKGEDWPINITNDKTVEVQIQGKNNATGQTNPINVKIKNF